MPTPRWRLRLQAPRQPSSEEEDLPLGQLAQQAQHNDQEAQQAKRRKVEIPDDQEDATSWGCYKSAEHVGKLIDYLDYKGKRISVPPLASGQALGCCVTKMKERAS